MREVSLGAAEFAALSAGILGRGGAFCFRARGASMAPFIRDGDTLTVRPTAAAALRPGDVILYPTQGERLAAHRVTGRRVDGNRVILVVRGDAATGPGEAVAAERVLGRVVRLQRGARTLDLDRGARRLLARLWVATAPLGPWLLHGLARSGRLGGRLLGRLQGLRPYRRLARAAIGRRIRYRAATVDDAPALAALYGYGNMPDLADPVGAWVAHLAGLDGRGQALVARLGDRLVGAATIRRGDTGAYAGWWLSGMTVCPRYRGAGAGQELLRRALAMARQAGAGRVYLRVSLRNRAALALYHKIGFRPVSATEDEPDRLADSGEILLVYDF